MINPIHEHYKNLHNKNIMPENHIKHLEKLKEQGFNPKVIYDIGACVLHWTDHAKKIWPEAEIILFEANPHCTFLYKDYKYYSGILSNASNTTKKFYLNEYFPEGSSYYQEIGSEHAAILFPSNKYYEIQSMTLDDVVKKFNFPLPDLVKMDVQGSEYDILLGSKETLKNTKYLIMELPKNGIHYNEDAPDAEKTTALAESLGWKCTDPLFCDNGIYDGDYGFTK